MSMIFGRLPVERIEQRMGELKPPFDAGAAIAEANRCLYCHDAPCTAACPTHIDVPEFIRRIASGNLKASARTILDANILGFSCARVCPVEVLCEGACVYTRMGRPPIAIGRLQRYATDPIVERGVRIMARSKPTGRKVAIVGGGPAGLACAHELSLLGHDSVIHEGRDLPGGLNTTGVAPYKMHADDALRETGYVLGVGGITLRTGVFVGKDVSFADLEQGYDAIFIGAGLGPDSRLRVPGADLAGVIGACEIIERWKTGARFALDGLRSACVVGGGNTAVDVVRQLARLGVLSVTLAYRRGPEEMPAYAHEVAYARKEGVRFEMLCQPVAVEPAPPGTPVPPWLARPGAPGRAATLVCQRTRLGAPGPDGRRRPEPVAGSEFRLEADLVVAATGQETAEEMLRGAGLALVDGKLPIDPATGATRKAGYFAGGDLVNGGKEVVNAVADGKVAARGIDRYVRETNR